MPRLRNPSGTQEERVLKALEAARRGELRGDHVLAEGWVNKQYFLRVLGLTQAGRAIWNLEHEKKVEIEHSSDERYDFRDPWGFVYYRLRMPEQGTLLP